MGLYSFDLSNFEAGKFTATRYPERCAVSGDWVCVADSDARALELAHTAAHEEWAAPDTREVDDFTVDFSDATSQEESASARDPKIVQALSLVSGHADRALAALLAYVYASDADDAKCKRVAEALETVYAVASEGADDERRLQIALGIRVFAHHLGIPVPRLILGRVRPPHAAWQAALDVAPDDVRRASDDEQ